ncbi:MAG: glycosyltransferase family 2 protein [Saprospiraceae bacterium]
MKADVSVIIPTFNRLWCLPRAIDSCRNTKCKTEIIVVDDGSTDGTWEWLQSQSDIIPLFQKNQGQTWAVNRGVEHATGRYIRFLDSDDFLCQGTIDRQYETAVETGADIVYSRVDHYDESSKAVFQEHPDTTLWRDFLEIQLGTEYGSHFLGMLFKKEMIEDIPRRPDFALREDRMFLLEVGLKEPKLATVAGCAGYWVRHKSQMHTSYAGMINVVANWQHLNIYKKILGELASSGKLTEPRKKAASNILWILAHWVSKTHLKEGKKVADWVFDLNPDFKIPEKGILGLLFNNLGFLWTQRILKLRRLLIYGSE